MPMPCRTLNTIRFLNGIIVYVIVPLAKFNFGSVQRRLVETERTNLLIITLPSVMSAICGLLFLFQAYGIAATGILGLSPNPSGIFTLVFVHNGWDHLSGNISMMWTHVLAHADEVTETIQHVKFR